MYKWLSAAIVIAIVATGCSAGARNHSSPSPQNNGQVTAQQNTSGKKQIVDRTEVEAHLEELAKGIQGVDNAHCVVIGNTAIVGIDVDGNLERSRVGTIKYSVAEAFRKDPYGIDAFVTADIDINNRLREIGEDLRQGRPIAGFAEELADIMGRLVPQMPRDIVSPAVDDEDVNQFGGPHDAKEAKPDAQEANMR
ncbi:YhcN/YlaJ family sporulation lipoprotein [Paenibacillus sp. PL2-23]|uniref:YhcN/YlaJ family sporulation lipoprotein n=1 Tax=Paenibacillus sp. PL2-23 TaxID=2100729 RepID=UPI0030FD1AB8